MAACVSKWCPSSGTKSHKEHVLRVHPISLSVLCLAFSFNCVDWLLLPPVTEDMLKQVSQAAKGRFRGDPSYVYEHLEVSGKLEHGQVWIFFQTVSIQRIKHTPM